MPEFREYMLPVIEKEGDAGIRTAVRFKLENVPPTNHVAYMKALAERSRLVREWTLFMERVPLVLAPICSEPVYEQGFDIESAARTAALWRECATMMAVPVLGLPAVAVPTGLADGMPMGVQIIGPRFREDALPRLRRGDRGAGGCDHADRSEMVAWGNRRGIQRHSGSTGAVHLHVHKGSDSMNKNIVTPLLGMLLIATVHLARRSQPRSIVSGSFSKGVRTPLPLMDSKMDSRIWGGRRARTTSWKLAI